MIEYLLNGDNNPSNLMILFDSSDHIRFQNGIDVSGHNIGCHRRFVIENNIQGNVGYTITMYNMDGIHSLWRNNIQMSPKQMEIVNVSDNIVEMRGYGYDEHAIAIGAPMEAASFSNYGLILLIENNEIHRVQLNMYDRNISIVYLK